MPEFDDPRYIKAMSHPLRVRILAMLGERPGSPVELAPKLGVSLSLTSYHVRTLYRLGLIELVRTTPVRGAIEHHYQATERPRVTDEAWEAAAPVAKQAAIGSTLQMIDDYARASAAAGGFDHREAHLSRTSLEVDAEGRQELAEACRRLVDDVERIERESAKRLAKQGDDEAGRSRASVVVMAFESVRLSDEESVPAARTPPGEPAPAVS